ncbi:MAG: ATP-dependent DNA helicase RecG [Eubacterium sp.]|nr:ATP-dependent DNA helicase RecG [Eubacterium sp.]
MDIYDSVKAIKGVGDKACESYEKLGIYTVGDLVSHFPRDYDYIRPIQPIHELREGDIAAIEGRLIARPKIKKAGRLNLLTIQLEDGGPKTIDITWFNMAFLKNKLHLGTSYIFRGNVKRFRERLVMEQPKIYTKTEFYNMSGSFRPVYGLTKGLTNNAVTKAINISLNEIETPKEYLPPEIRKEHNLIGYAQALRGIHFPKDKNVLIESRKRLVFDELLLYLFALRLIKKNAKSQSEYIIKRDKNVDEWILALPFELTKAQQKAYEDVVSDMERPYVMSRLMQGDVGSGKTVVALAALLQVVKNGYQGALMVPTEVLAKQHMKSFEKMTDGVKIGLLTGSMTAKQKNETKALIASGGYDIVIGTHAILQEDVEFANLALVVTDEQHRFGVRQRETFAGKGAKPHVLAMSATPIPRTLALILYGDMDLSVIDEKPANRLPVKNALVNGDYRPNAYKFIEKRVADGEQVYIICPMIDESEESDLENVTIYTEKLKNALPDGIRIASLTGKMSAKEKDEIMESFASHDTDVLVSTTVIEVGIDVANATTIIIENAERFGLATLHQLRGRVGRGDKQSYCIFMMGTESEKARERLQILERSNDGFLVASEDLKMRGQGDLFGTEQSGEKIFALADIYEDAKILELASETAKSFDEEELRRLIKENPRLRARMDHYMGDITL